MFIITILILLSGLGLAFDPVKVNYTACNTGNPFIPGVFGHADSVTYNDTFWIYHANFPGNTSNSVIDAYSSTDLVDWKSQPMVLNLSDFSGARGSIASVSAVTINNHYYLYFSTTTNTSGDSNPNGSAISSAIFVGTAESPQGPFKNAREGPIWSSDRDTNMAPTDKPSVLVAGDGKAYLYYTSGTSVKVLHLQDDMINVDAASLKDVTPVNLDVPMTIVENSKVFQHGNRYYMIFKGSGRLAEPNSTGTLQSIRFATSYAPAGRFNYAYKILGPNPALATILGHGTVLIVPGTDIAYLVYSRNLTLNDGTGVGGLAYDRMYINAPNSGSGPAWLMPVEMAVKENFDYPSVLTWGARWKNGWENISLPIWEDSEPNENYLFIHGDGDGRATMYNNFSSLTYDISVGGMPPLQAEGKPAYAGVLFRVVEPALNQNPTDPDRSHWEHSYRGYFAGVTNAGMVVLGVANGTWRELSHGYPQVTLNLTLMNTHLRVHARGTNILVYVNDMDKPVIDAVDDTYSSGRTGVRAWLAPARFDNLEITGQLDW